MIRLMLSAFQSIMSAQLTYMMSVRLCHPVKISYKMLCCLLSSSRKPGLFIYEPWPCKSSLRHQTNRV